MNHTYNGMPAAELPDVTWEKKAQQPQRCLRGGRPSPRGRHRRQEFALPVRPGAGLHSRRDRGIPGGRQVRRVRSCALIIRTNPAVLIATAQEPSATAGLSSAATLEEETAEIHRDRRRLEDLDPATDIPSLTETQPTARQQTQRLADELGIAVKALGDSAKVHAARTEGGRYRGTIIGETAAHVVQRESGQSAVTHPKELLDRQPQVGETVRINYSNSRGQVREAQERSKHQELGR